MARRQEILDAALAAFTEKGYAAATIGDVRTRSGASTGSIYHWFGSKEQIAGALYVEGLRDYQEGFLDVLRRHRSAERGVKALVAHHVDWVVENPDLARFLLSGREAEVVLASQRDLRDLNRQFLAEVNAWFAEREELRPVSADLLHAVLIGPAQEWSRHWLSGSTETDPAHARRFLAEAAWRALRRGEPR